MAKVWLRQFVEKDESNSFLYYIFMVLGKSRNIKEFVVLIDGLRYAGWKFRRDAENQVKSLSNPCHLNHWFKGKVFEIVERDYKSFSLAL